MKSALFTYYSIDKTDVNYIRWIMRTTVLFVRVHFKDSLASAFHLSLLETTVCRRDEAKVEEEKKKQKQPLMEARILSLFYVKE